MMIPLKGRGFMNQGSGLGIRKESGAGFQRLFLKVVNHFSGPYNTGSYRFFQRHQAENEQSHKDRVFFGLGLRVEQIQSRNSGFHLI